jgi:hypothetical protein
MRSQQDLSDQKRENQMERYKEGGKSLIEIVKENQNHHHGHGHQGHHHLHQYGHGSVHSDAGFGDADEDFDGKASDIFDYAEAVPKRIVCVKCDGELIFQSRKSARANAKHMFVYISFIFQRSWQTSRNGMQTSSGETQECRMQALPRLRL